MKFEIYKFIYNNREPITNRKMLSVKYIYTYTNIYRKDGLGSGRGRGNAKSVSS